MSAVLLPLRFQVGARTLAAIPRRLVRVPLSLDDALAARVPPLPPLHGDGYLVTSLPQGCAVAPPGMLRFTRQRYQRYYVDLKAGQAAWLAGLSGAARSGLKRKAKKLAQASGGALDIAAAHSAEALATVLPAMRQVAATTYQERLLGVALPGDAELLRRAAADQVRGWLLSVAGQPAAFLLCTADRGTLRYDHVGHDPAYGALSPGSVLMAEALGELMRERRFARFDFTEGEGQHKRQFATGSVACVDLLLLRPTLANRTALAALAGFDAALRIAKRAATAPWLRGVAKRVRR